jgi:hypothetical protein
VLVLELLVPDDVLDVLVPEDVLVPTCSTYSSPRTCCSCQPPLLRYRQRERERERERAHVLQVRARPKPKDVMASVVDC